MWMRPASCRRSQPRRSVWNEGHLHQAEWGVGMTAEDIKKAAALLEARSKLQALRSTLVKKPGLDLGLFGSDGDGGMLNCMTIDNELGRALLEVALKANAEALNGLGVDEFVGVAS